MIVGAKEQLENMGVDKMTLEQLLEEKQKMVDDIKHMEDEKYSRGSIEKEVGFCPSTSTFFGVLCQKLSMLCNVIIEHPQCTDSIREQCFKQKGEAEYKDNRGLYKDRDELYRWKASCTVENEVVKVSFRTSTHKLYVCDRAQGLGVVDDVANLSYKDRTYYDYFIATAVEGGYRLFVADDVNDDDATGRNVACDTETNQWRLATTGHVINFHRIAKATFSETSSDAVKYPVIINADDVVAGKYVIAGYNAVHNDYYLLPGTEIASPPIASVASENGIQFEDNILVTDPANVSDLYVWNITPSATSGYYTIQNVQTDNYIFSRDAAAGVIVGPVGINSKHKNEWTFNNIGGVMVAQVSGCTTRALVPYDVPGVYWRMQGTGTLTDYILLIPINE